LRTRTQSARVTFVPAATRQRLPIFYLGVLAFTHTAHICTTLLPYRVTRTGVTPARLLRAATTDSFFRLRILYRAPPFHLLSISVNQPHAHTVAHCLPPDDLGRMDGTPTAHRATGERDTAYPHPHTPISTVFLPRGGNDVPYTPFVCVRFTGRDANVFSSLFRNCTAYLTHLPHRA